ncbi:ribonuclease III [Dacryopinax primogenitus]|uniref:Ribonuclease III n=1 Tax=Dacryopinax primogenitus (strain DJM 731) TaxID=1858805 RepID=M5GDY8_DACPD|nr:ribonuclease III [Dacryopinax primogenitus]EJU04937.1 ribonuclease III [Dacryopinax primogenitus]
MVHDVPLPPIQEADRRLRVFSHRGLPKDNTRFALLGAALLGTIATLYKLVQFPDGTSGDITEERSELMRQDAMAWCTTHYGLEKQLRARENTESVRQAASAQATLFQAYVAAVFLESNFDFSLIRNWLFSLWDLRSSS